MKSYAELDVYQKDEILLLSVLAIELSLQLVPLYLPHIFAETIYFYSVLSLIGYILFPIFFFGALCFGIKNLFHGCYYSNKRLIRTSSLALIVSVLFVCGIQHDGLLFRTHKNNNISYHTEKYFDVITAIENYKSDHKHYPKSLEQLTPNYIKSIPKARLAITNKLQYSERGTGFRLSFSQRNVPLFHKDHYYIFYDTNAEEEIKKTNYLNHSEIISSSEIDGKYWYCAYYP